MTSPVPGLRLLDESRTRDGQGEDLDEDDVWNVADDREEDDVFPEDDSDVERSDADDDPTVECVSGRMDLADDDFAAASPAASSLPRAIARGDATRGPVAKHDMQSNEFGLLEKKPRVTVSASLGRLELTARRGAASKTGRVLFPHRHKRDAAEDDDDDDQKTYINPNGSFREGFVPPHVYATTHSTYSSVSGAGYMEARFNNGQSVPGLDRRADFGSMVSGKGHTLKGRDALKARTAVLRSTGFLERETPGTPRGDVEAPRQSGAQSPAPIAGFDVTTTPGEVAGRT